MRQSAGVSPCRKGTSDLPSQAWGTLTAYPGEDGGHDVDGLGWQLAREYAHQLPGGLWRRITNHQRNMETLVVVAELAQEVMVTELFTVGSG